MTTDGRFARARNLYCATTVYFSRRVCVVCARSRAISLKNIAVCSRTRRVMCIARPSTGYRAAAVRYETLRSFLFYFLFYSFFVSIIIPRESLPAPRDFRRSIRSSTAPKTVCVSAATCAQQTLLL